MRMARVNITIPDEQYRQARDADLNISRLTRTAIVDELRDQARVAAAYEHLEDLEKEFGPINPADQAGANAQVDRIIARAEGSEASA